MHGKGKFQDVIHAVVVVVDGGLLVVVVGPVVVVGGSVVVVATGFVVVVVGGGLVVVVVAGVLVVVVVAGGLVVVVGAGADAAGGWEIVLVGPEVAVALAVRIGGTNGAVALVSGAVFGRVVVASWVALPRSGARVVVVVGACVLVVVGTGALSAIVLAVVLGPDCVAGALVTGTMFVAHAASAARTTEIANPPATAMRRMGHDQRSIGLGFICLFIHARGPIGPIFLFPNVAIAFLAQRAILDRSGLGVS
jgi:hypothetical protein